MVDHGALTPEVNDPTTNAWGKTVGNAAYVWRSAIGTRPDGSVLFAIGPAMNIQTLAQVMKAGGADEAMQLDINKDRTSFITYGRPGATPSTLTADEFAPANRYLEPSSRDFVDVVPR